MDKKSGRKSSPSCLISFGWGFSQDWAIECEDEGRVEDPKVTNALFGKYSIYMRCKGTNYEDTWALFTFPNHSSCQSFTKQGPHLTSGLGHWGCLCHKLVGSVSSGRCWFGYDWGVIGFCPPARRDTSHGGRCPSCPVGRTQFSQSIKFTLRPLII